METLLSNEKELRQVRNRTIAEKRAAAAATTALTSFASRQKNSLERFATAKLQVFTISRARYPCQAWANYLDEARRTHMEDEEKRAA